MRRLPGEFGRSRISNQPIPRVGQSFKAWGICRLGRADVFGAFFPWERGRPARISRHANGVRLSRLRERESPERRSERFGTIVEMRAGRPRSQGEETREEAKLPWERGLLARVPRETHRASNSKRRNVGPRLNPGVLLGRKGKRKERLSGRGATRDRSASGSHPPPRHFSHPRAWPTKGSGRWNVWASPHARMAGRSGPSWTPA